MIPVFSLKTRWRWIEVPAAENVISVRFGMAHNFQIATCFCQSFHYVADGIDGLQRLRDDELVLSHEFFL